MISNSGHDERGRATGGQAGDQTGTEWQIRTWYSSPWRCVLRHPDANVRKMIAELARQAANNNAIGYNQYNRTSFWRELEKSDYLPKNIKNKCDGDCSAGVSAIVKAVGYILNIQKLKDIAPTNWTGSMRTNFKVAGFEVLTESKYLTSDAYLLAGDILLNDSKHTCINVDNGSKANASTPTKPLGGSTTALKSYSGTFPSVLTNLKKGSKGTAVKNLQKYLNWFDGKYKLVVDGEFGVLTETAVRDFQRRTGLEVDGIFGKKSLAMAKTIKK